MRTVITATDTLHSLKTGCIYNPLDKRLHAWDCQWVGRMKASQKNPKWHFIDAATAATYLEEHHARWGGKPWELAQCCLRGAQRPALPDAIVRARRGNHPPLRCAPEQADVEIEHFPGGFEAWAPEYVTNESRSDSSAGALRRLLLRELRELQPEPGQFLHATYGGHRWPGTDVENLLFNNLDQTLGAFGRLGGNGVCFEDLGNTIPVAPSFDDRWDRSCYYRYAIAGPGANVTVQFEQKICAIPEVEVAPGTARLSARILVAVLSARADASGEELQAEPYGLRIVVRGLSPGKTVKAVVDGASAALQRSTHAGDLAEAITRLASLTGADARDLARLQAGPAPLGAAKRLLSLDGQHQVRVTPDDERCIAAEVISAGDATTPRVAVEAWTVTRT